MVFQGDPRRRPAGGWIAGLLGLVVAALPAAAQDDSQQASSLSFARIDPLKVQTAEACGECHVSELAVWKQTTHAQGFRTLHRRQAAETIAGKLGLRLIKRDSPCLGCHYTPQVDDGELRAISGVSCESCHGAGADWINVHNDYGGKGFDHRSETPEHRRQRIAASRAAGMRRPSDVYLLAKSCFGCHTVPDERLVNVGGHPSGSAGFELLEWAEGEVRHNFLDSFLEGDGTQNAQRPQEHRRLMYVVGRALDLEHGLRGVAAATEEGVYLSAMIRRVRAALNEVRAIGRGAELPQVQEMIAAVRGVQVGLGQRQALLAAAERVGAAAKALLEAHDGSRLAALDPLLRGESLEDDEVVVAEDAGAGGTPAGAAGQPTATGPGAASAQPAGAQPAGAQPAGAQTTPAPASGAVAAVGEVKRRIRPSSQHRTVGPSTCTGCHRHSPQSEWWVGDAHYRAADPFFDSAPKNVQIARLYGIRPERMSRGDSLCMDCHATVVSGKEKREVNDGVGCESCHGPAADYLDPHQEGEASLGDRRPGYVQALKLGMRELRDLEVRAETCTGCHYVTDPRLISAGHPSGAGFDYRQAMSKIRHWEEPPADPARLRAAFDTVLAARGAVPQVRRASLGSVGGGQPGRAAATEGRPPGTTAPSSGGASTPSGNVPGAASGEGASAPSIVGLAAGSTTSGAASEADSSTAELGLPPFPEIGPETPIEDVLLLLKERLEQLYRALDSDGAERRRE